LLLTPINPEPTHKKIYQKIKFFGGWYKYMENVELSKIGMLLAPRKIAYNGDRGPPRLTVGSGTITCITK
jgi:hypothetical protein